MRRPTTPFYTIDPHAPLFVGIGEILWDLLPDGRQPGGAPANVAWHASQLGLRSTIVSAVGHDTAGRDLLAHLEGLGMDRSRIRIDSGHPTGTAGVVLDAQGRSTFTITEGVAWDHLPLDPGLLHLAEEADAVCVGTLAQRNEVSRRTIQVFLNAARSGCLRVYDVNLRQHYFNAAILARTIACSHVVKVNDEEWPVVARLLELPEDPRLGANVLRKRHHLHVVAITCGSAGSVICDRSGLHEQACAPCRVVDTIGAGDAFTAALIAGLMSDMPIDRIHARAAQVAAQVCSQAGATPVLPMDLRTWSPPGRHQATEAIHGRQCP